MFEPPRLSWKLLTALLLLSLVPVAAGTVRLMESFGGGSISPDNERFMTAPGPVVVHIVCATVFCLLGACQFDSALRLRYRLFHRIVGNVVAPCGILSALTGVWMTVRYAIPAPLQGSLLYGMRLAAGLGMAMAISLALVAVVRGRIAQHRAWMIRAYALGQGAGTQVFILLPMSLIAGAPIFMPRDVLMASAWVLNLAVAEWLIRRRPSFI
jgi:hypothetical protein